MNLFDQLNTQDVYTSTFRVYTEDTDLYGVVYHANFLRFYERARTEMLRTLGMSLVDLASQGTLFTIYDAHVRYSAPARLDDLITIETSCASIKTCSIIFQQIMLNQHKQVISKASIEVVCLNDQFKPQKLAIRRK